MADLVTFKPFVRPTVQIVNPSEQSGQPLFLEVPTSANHFNRKRFCNDWTLRTWFEYKDSVCTFFLTLTFDEYHVPRFSDGTLGFRPDIVEKFLKRLRSRLERTYKIPRGSLKFFLCSEYGSNTHRPHHHALFFFNTFVSLPVMQEVVHKTWQQGFTSVEIPDSARVVGYVSKYVCKDMHSMDLFTSKDDPDNYELRSIYNFSTHSYDVYKVTRYNFHRQSMGFGASLIKNLTIEDWKNGVKWVSMDGSNTIPFHIPKYASDKTLRYLEYYMDDKGKKHSISHTTQFGEEVKTARVRQVVDDVYDFCIKYSDEQNQRYVLDNFGIDIDPLEVDVNAVMARNRWHTHVVFGDDLFEYLRNRRFHSPSLDSSEISPDCRRDSLTYNVYYEGYERLLLYIADVEFILACKKQRADEKKEFDKLLKKRRYGRSY